MPVTIFGIVKALFLFLKNRYAKTTGINIVIRHRRFWGSGGTVTAVMIFAFLRAKAAMLSARLSHRNSVRPSVRPSVRSSVRPSLTRVDQAKTVQARISKSSPSAAWKTLVSGTVKLFHKFEGGHPERGR